MDWMIAYQDARRNMNDAEKIYANDEARDQFGLLIIDEIENQNVYNR